MRDADFKRSCVDNIRLAAKMKFRVFAAALGLVGGQHAETALPTPIGIPRIENLDGLDQFDFSASSTLIHPCLTDPLLGLPPGRHPGDASEDRRADCGGLGGGAGGFGGGRNMLLGLNTHLAASPFIRPTWRSRRRAPVVLARPEAAALIRTAPLRLESRRS